MSAPTLRIALPDAAATEALGAALASWLTGRRGALIALAGDLGAGKTTLARGLLHALGVQGSVRSPSYTLLEPYTLPGRTVLHMDLFRLRDAAELLGLGVDDTPPSEAVWLVEWPEHGAGVLPAADLEVRLSMAGEARRAQITVAAAERDALIAAARRQGLAAHIETGL